MREIIIGALTMGYAVAGMFFLRFWRDTRDRLFLLFAVAFFVLSMNRAGFAFIHEQDSHGDYLYWIRLVAFLIMLIAIIDKNFLQKGNDR
jgi:hypothetical protein